jgi:ubiquinol-cytochrome c reductase iron-sulfur subunit
MAPSADILALDQTNVRSVRIESLEPGDAKIFAIGGKPIVVWRRSPGEMAKAMAQLKLGISEAEFAKVLNDGSVALEIGPDAYARLEWFIGSPVNVSGYRCIVHPKMGDYGGFFDPCSATHFDMWGRPRKGLLREALKIPSFVFSHDRKSVLLDPSEMPSTR